VTSASPATRAISRLNSLGTRLGPRGRAAAYVLALAGVAAATLAFGLWGAGRLRTPTGALLQPGAVTMWGLPISRVVVDVSVVGTIGMLITCLLLPRADGQFGDAARRCLHSASWTALAWALSTAAMLVLTWSDLRGLPIDRLPLSQVLAGPGESFRGASTYFFAAVLAVIIAVGARMSRTWIGVVIVLGVAAYNVLPLTTLGHTGISSFLGPVLTVHVLAIAVWAGALAGLLVHARRSPALLEVAVPRFSRISLACFVAVGASGITAAWLNLGEVSELRASHFGTLVLYKAEALTALGIIAWWHRRRTIPQVVGRRAPRAFIRLAAAEVVIMIAALALGVALSRTPAPATPDPVKPPSQGPYASALAPHV
jgi:putative copper export protein